MLIDSHPIYFIQQIIINIIITTLITGRHYLHILWQPTVLTNLLFYLGNLELFLNLKFITRIKLLRFCVNLYKNES